MRGWLVGATAAAGMISACATITTGTDQPIRIITEQNVVGASCTLLDSKGNRSYLPRTPGTTYITRGNAPLTVRCSKEGFKTTTFVVDEGIAGATMGNVILGGGVGFILDAASGAGQRYPDEIVIWLEPDVWEDEASQRQWQEQRRAYMEELASRRSSYNDTDNAPAY